MPLSNNMKLKVAAILAAKNAEEVSQDAQRIRDLASKKPNPPEWTATHVSNLANSVTELARTVRNLANAVEVFVEVDKEEVSQVREALTNSSDVP